MSIDDCIFCKIVAGQIPCRKIYEDEAVLAFLDIEPVSDGHTLVIPKAHFKKMHDCPVDVLAKLSSHLGKIADAVVSAMEAEAYNILCNNGRAAGQLVEHLHFHIIPRNSNDGVFDHWPAYEYEEGQADAILERIYKKL